ncbi:SepM family pheromone-processing serine protease [Bhargavaea cecembensis]|uniref:SepM family pheromone-processing serine protease n=1 Tax=Bhargavaea cecembensis TaxID=394098 RepID=UPI0009EDC12E|nr:SepM family pheromone-processing serine protease [Bhargavaea cecembensis]
MNNVKRIALTAVLLLFAAAALLPLDMYIQKPGGAYELSPLVEVKGGDSDDEGSLSLMTIALSKATPLTYAVSGLMDSRKIMKAGQVRRDGESEEEYNLRQLQLMEDSQINAIYVAYNRAGKPVTLETEGVIVLDVVEGSAADGNLKAGDLITGVEGEPVVSSDGFAEMVASVPTGDSIRLSILRDDEEMEEEISPGTIPGTGGRKGLGVSYAAKRMIETDPEVEIETEDIGGPSAGLMFTLEIMNQLMDEDLTKGYRVAGTGEMNEDGTVGRIGGIDFKVMAADREDIEIFFAPDDEITDEMRERIPGIRSNYETAAETAEKIGTDMKIVPVKTIDDALDYLEALNTKRK